MWITLSLMDPWGHKLRVRKDDIKAYYADADGRTVVQVGMRKYRTIQREEQVAEALGDTSNQPGVRLGDILPGVEDSKVKVALVFDVSVAGHLSNVQMFPNTQEGRAMAQAHFLAIVKTHYPDGMGQEEAAAVVAERKFDHPLGVVLFGMVDCSVNG